MLCLQKKSPLSWERPFFLVTLNGASGHMKLPHLHPGKLYSHVCANIIFLTLSMGWIHCYSCLRFLVQPEEAVHQKFMPVSLQWAQLLNEIVLSACALQGGQHFRPIYFLLGEFKADIQDTVCLHTQSWNDTILSMRNFFPSFICTEYCFLSVGIVSCIASLSNPDSCGLGYTQVCSCRQPFCGSFLAATVLPPS